MRRAGWFLWMALLALPLTTAARAQVVMEDEVGIGPVLVAPPVVYAPPVCDWGYYPYYPYGCAPYGYYGPEWFADGIFIGIGPWYHWGGHHGWGPGGGGWRGHEWGGGGRREWGGGGRGGWPSGPPRAFGGGGNFRSPGGYSGGPARAPSGGGYSPRGGYSGGHSGGGGGGGHMGGGGGPHR